MRWLSGSLLTLLALVHELDTLLDKLPGDVNEALDLISHCDSCMCKIRREKEMNEKIGRIKSREVNGRRRWKRELAARKRM